MRYWKRLDLGGNTTTVESYSHNADILGAIEISDIEFNAFLASLPPPATTDWKALWQAATTVSGKMAIIAKLLRLE